MEWLHPFCGPLRLNKFSILLARFDHYGKRWQKINRCDAQIFWDLINIQGLPFMSSTIFCSKDTLSNTQFKKLWFMAYCDFLPYSIIINITDPVIPQRTDRPDTPRDEAASSQITPIWRQLQKANTHGRRRVRSTALFPFLTTAAPQNVSICASQRRKNFFFYV